MDAQENQAGQDQNDQQENIGKYLSFQATLSRPVAFGDNFANDALSQKFGYKVALRFYLYKSFFLGVEVGSFTADVENKELLGDYERSNANTYGITAGYTFSFDKSYDIDAAVAFGSANYRNKKDDLDDRFVDRGNYVKLQIQYNYNFSQSFSAYVLAGWRHDYLDIDTSPLIDNFINQANYLTFGIGVKYTLIGDKIELW